MCAWAFCLLSPGELESATSEMEQLEEKGSKEVPDIAKFVPGASSTQGYGQLIKANLRGNATGGQAANKTEDMRRLAAVVPSTCSRGTDAVDDCTGKGGSCTPYPFLPHTLEGYDSEESWQDKSPWNTQAFVPYNENSYQAYRTPSASDVWVVHGHDGAGAQAVDCGGDVHYFEHFQEDGTQACEKVQYPAQDNHCYLEHPGLGKTFDQYQCGWWRGYDNAWDASLWKAWDNIGVNAQGLLTEEAAGVKEQAMNWLRQCDNCPADKDGVKDGSLHTWANVGKPVAWFTGVLFPLVCSWTDGETDTLPWTGEEGKKCYCDNEPWGGRDIHSKEPNHYLAVVYCAKYENEYGMHCDLINFKCDAGSCSGSTVTAKDFWVGESNFP